MPCSVVFTCPAVYIYGGQLCIYVMCVCVMDSYVLYCICDVCVFLRVLCVYYISVVCVVSELCDCSDYWCSVCPEKKIRVRYVSKTFIQFVQNVLLKCFQHILNVSKYFENILCGLWKKTPKRFLKRFCNIHVITAHLENI